MLAAAVAGPDRGVEHQAPGGVHLHGAGQVAVQEDSQLPGLPRPAGVQRGKRFLAFLQNRRQTRLLLLLSNGDRESDRAVSGRPAGRLPDRSPLTAM